MSLLIKSPPKVPGFTPIAALKYIDFGRLILQGNYSGKTGDKEVAMDVFSGRCRVSTSAGVLEAGGVATKGVSLDVGGRRDAFDGAPAMIYLPPGTEYKMEGDATIGVFSAPANGVKQAPVAIPPEQAMVNKVGRDNWIRTVYTSIGEKIAAQRLIVGETVNPPGNWSSSPPHKHDRYNPPGEVPMEEIYYFQITPAQGFGFMRIYTHPDDPQPMDEACVVEDGDTVVIPRGYHPVVAAPGYTLNYTWALAGQERRYGAWSDDPRHCWIRN